MHTPYRRLLGLALLLASLLPGAAQSTAFMYQGRLNANGVPVTGNYDLTFTLYNAATNGTELGAQTNVAVPVASGLFTVMLNFGNVFTGPNYWLGIGARTNGNGGFTALLPCQPLAPTPYAIFAAASATANTAATAGVATNFSGGLAGDVTGTQTATTVATVGGATAANVAAGAAAANAATSAATGGTIVKRDASGNIAANSLTLNGNLNLPAATVGGGGIIYAGGNPLVHSAGTSNFFFGSGAGNLSITGSGNVGIGAGALASATTGSGNIAVGYQAGSSVTTGSGNIYIGHAGVAGETNAIRIGNGQTTTYLAGAVNGNGSGLVGITPAQIGAISTNQLVVLASVATNEDSLFLHTNNTFTYHGVNYSFPMSTTACLAEIDSLFPKASNGVPTGISIRLDDNAEYEMTSFVTLTNNYKIVGGGPWTSGFCYCGPTNVCDGDDVLNAWDMGDNQVYYNLPHCTFINFFPSSFPNWVGAFGQYQSPNIILEDFYVKTATNFPCILMGVEAYDFYCTRVGWYGSDVITDVSGNYAQTFPMNLGDIPDIPSEVGLFTSVINQETINDCTANELADGIIALGNTWCFLDGRNG